MSAVFGYILEPVGDLEGGLRGESGIEKLFTVKDIFLTRGSLVSGGWVGGVKGFGLNGGVQS